MAEKYVVGIADMKMAQQEGMLITYALGSCVGICLYDPIPKLAALIHILLPINMETGRKSPMKYADTGIRETLHQMERKGAIRERSNASRWPFCSASQVSVSFPATASPSIRAALAHSRILFSTRL